MFVDINKIVVNGRIRKDFGNIEELANDIRENGLINPPVVTPDMELIAGERRLRAMKYLGWPQVEVRVMTVQDAFHQFKLEISENENRKDFTFSERRMWVDRLREEYQRIAEANSAANGFGDTSVAHATLVGRVDDKVADETGFGSARTLHKSDYIAEHANEEMIRQLDEGQLSINGAYVRLKKQAEEAETKLLEKDKQIADLQAEAAEATRAVKASTDSEEYMRAMKAKEDLEGECRKEYEARKVLETKVGDKDKQIAMLREQFNNATKKLNELQRQKEVMSEPEVREVEVEVEVYPEDYERLKRERQCLDEENERLSALVASLKVNHHVARNPFDGMEEEDDLEGYYDKVTMFAAAVVPEIDSIMVGAERFALMTVSQREFIGNRITQCIHSFNQMMAVLKNSNKEAA